MNKKYIYIISAAVVLMIVLIVAKKKGWLGEDNNAKEVTTAKVELVNITESVSSSGKIKPEVEVKIAPEVSGEIIKLTIKEGQDVKKGQLLVSINPDIYESSVNRAQAALQSSNSSLLQAKARLLESEQDYKRNKQLFNNNTIAQSDWDKMKANYSVAKLQVESAQYQVSSSKATLREAKDNLARTNIYSPMDGTISKLNVELGERVVGTAQMAGTELLRVANLFEMEAEVDVNENDIIKVKIGDETDIEVDAFLNKKFKGIVTEIANSAETAGTSADQVTNFKVKVKILKESYEAISKEMGLKYSPFRPGMTATVDINTKNKDGIIGVDISAVTTRSDSLSISDKRKERKKSTKKDDDDMKTTKNKKELFECVFIIDNEGNAKIRVVETGIQNDEKIEITKGLKEGDIIITGPYTLVSRTLKQGMKVKQEDEDSNDED
ncbi:MAG: efflux RND transporter periplasmic adaptor subunit [Flavobacteriales bacterium]|nr:efflux RND transporter periplasmic adaptor subunit [Flavobacteriales bacterium]